jgi:hypothetical protein
MCDFNTLSDEDKKIQHKEILQYAESFGGQNFFLKLIEAIRETTPHPLIALNSKFNMELGYITWNKVIFNDKLQLLQKARMNETKQNNLLPQKDDKNYKKVLNLLRTLKPIVFHVKPKNIEDGTGFFFQAFEIIDKDTTKLNPIFDALFFCSIDNIKKALNYKPKDRC